MTLAAHAAWEAIQMPLYTLWSDGTRGEVAFAVVHCTGGDLLIALSTLTGALIVAGDPAWPSKRFREVATLTLVLGLAYTVYSEWLNVNVRRSWAFAAAMPLIPPLGTGLTPVLQWIVIPYLTFRVVHRATTGEIPAD